MKKMLNTLYVLSEDVYLALDGENVIILRDDEKVGRFPLHTLENISCFSYKGGSPALMGACVDRGIGMSFYTPRGKFLTRLNGMSHGNVLLRKEQYRISDDAERSIKYARNMIIGKIYNSRWSLERTIRDHSMRINTERIKSVSEEMQNSLSQIMECQDAETLLGIEGKLASRYFHIFDELIINQKAEFCFTGRNRRPPLDYTNALLSFAYVLLANSCADALEGVGLDAYVGFMHRDRPGRKSLALDLMEELRSVFADRFVLMLINKKMIKPEHFQKQADGAVLLKEDGRRIFLNAWQQRKKEKITHPFLKEKIDWGLVPHIQAMLLARTIRGDLEEYPPFLWK